MQHPTRPVLLGAALFVAASAAVLWSPAEQPGGVSTGGVLQPHADDKVPALGTTAVMQHMKRAAEGGLKSPEMTAALEQVGPWTPAQAENTLPASQQQVALPATKTKWWWNR